MTGLAILVINIHYLFALTPATNIQNMSILSCKLQVTSITMSPTSLSPNWTHKKRMFYFKLTLVPFFSFRQFHTQNICYNARASSFHSPKNHTPIVLAYRLSLKWIKNIFVLLQASQTPNHNYDLLCKFIDPWLMTFIWYPLKVKKSRFNSQKKQNYIYHYHFIITVILLWNIEFLRTTLVIIYS